MIIRLLLIATILTTPNSLWSMSWWPLAFLNISHEADLDADERSDDERFFDAFFETLMLAEPLEETLKKLEHAYPQECYNLRHKDIFSRQKNTTKAILLRRYAKQLAPLFAHHTMPLKEANRPITTAVLSDNKIGIAQPQKIRIIDKQSHYDEEGKESDYGLVELCSSSLQPYQCGCFNPQDSSFYFHVQGKGIYRHHYIFSKYPKLVDNSLAKQKITRMIATKIEGSSLLICQSIDPDSRYFYSLSDAVGTNLYQTRYNLSPLESINNLDLSMINNQLHLVIHTINNNLYISDQAVTKDILTDNIKKGVSSFTFTKQSCISPKYTITPTGSIASINRNGQLHLTCNSMKWNKELFLSDEIIARNGLVIIPVYRNSFYLIGFDDIESEFCINNQNPFYMQLLLYNRNSALPIKQIGKSIIPESVSYSADGSIITFIEYQQNTDTYILHLWNNVQYITSLSLHQLILLIGLSYYLFPNAESHKASYIPHWNPHIKQGYHNIDSFWQEVFNSLPIFIQEVYACHKDYTCSECSTRKPNEMIQPHFLDRLTITDSYSQSKY